MFGEKPVKLGLDSFEYLNLGKRLEKIYDWNRLQTAAAGTI